MTNLHPDLDPDKFLKRGDIPDSILDNYYEGANYLHTNSKNSNGCGCLMWFIFALAVAVAIIYSK